jgi:hypothetical protein
MIKFFQDFHKRISTLHFPFHNFYNLVVVILEMSYFFGGKFKFPQKLILPP